MQAVNSQAQRRQVGTPWQEKHRPFVPIETAKQYRRAAIGVLRGAAICHAEIGDLRHLIETVQRAAKKAHRNPQDVKLSIHGGTIERCACDGLDIAVTLSVASIFSGNARFDRASFSGIVGFDEASFSGSARFGGASFSAEASFAGASFSGHAGFAGASFSGLAWFNGASFSGHASFAGASFSDSACWFARASFSGDAEFGGASFSGYTGFDGASFSGYARFAGASVFRQLALPGLRKRPQHLDVSGLDLRPGAAIELDLDHLRCEDHSAQNPDNEPWMVERDALSSRIALLDKQSMLRWTLECFDVVLWMRHPVRHAFGLGKRGDVIHGETSDNPRELRSAAAQYNILRNNFRTQPSTEQHEDLCHFRYMELIRRAAWRDRPALWKRVKLSLEWLVMRNMLGYMIYPIRIATTATMFLIIATLIFGLFAGPGTITHNRAETPDEAMQIWQSDPLNPLYFSLMTFVTLGYGDFAPLHWFKLLCGLEGFLGVALLALFTVAWGRKMIR